MHRRDPVVAGRRVAQDEHDDVGLEDVRHRADDGGVGGGRFEAGIDTRPERGQPGEQGGAIAQRLAFAGQREGRRDAVADEHERVEVALVEGRVVLAALDVEDTDQRSPPARSGTLTSHLTSGLAARYSGSSRTSVTSSALPVRMTRPTMPIEPSKVSMTSS